MNPLLVPAPHRAGYPAFDVIDDAHFAPAFESLFDDVEAKLTAIENDPAAPSFDNTVVQLEHAFAALHPALSVFYHLYAAHTSPTIDALSGTVAARSAALGDRIHLSEALYGRIAAVEQVGVEVGERQALLQRYLRDFRRAGAGLDAPAKARLTAINSEVATLTTAYGNAVRAGAGVLEIADVAQLAGLSADEIAAFAVDDGTAGQRWEIPLVSPTIQPLLAKLADEATRQRLLDKSVARGSNGEHGTEELVRTIALLRAERAALLGYATHADYVAEIETAGSAAAIRGLLDRLIPAAVANAAAEAKELAELAEPDELGPGDLSFWSERLRAQRFSLDSAEIAPYFELNRALVDGVFYAANLLYGISVTEVTDLPRHHPDARTFEVTDADGNHVGLFIFDPYARSTKKGGAWMTSLVDQSHLLGTTPVVVNVLNLTKPSAGAPTLLTIDEMTTLFHEFGHGLHGLLSDVEFPTFSGTSVPRDFVEYPSQLNEMWALHPDILANYARHYQTGEPLPQRYIDAIEAAQMFGQGYATTEYLAASVLDLAWHSLTHGETVDDVAAFEHQALVSAGFDPAAVPPRYRSTYFTHIFAGGYSAAYYSYIWAEVLDADSAAFIREAGGATREVGSAYRAAVLSRGGSVDPMDAYRAFRGQDPEIEPLLERRGLVGA